MGASELLFWKRLFTSNLTGLLGVEDDVDAAVEEDVEAVDAAVDDVGLLPQDVAVERPHVGEPVRLRPFRQIDDPRRRRRRLEHNAYLHDNRPIISSRAFVPQ